MPMTSCEIGLTVAVAVLAVLVMGVFLQANPGCRSVLSACRAKLGGATYAVDDAVIYGEPTPTIPQGNNDGMFGFAATPGSVAALQSAVAAAPDDIDGTVDVRTGLNTIVDGPTGAMGAAPASGLFSHAANLIPNSIDDGGMGYGGVRTDGALDIDYSGRGETYLSVRPGQSVTGSINPVFTTNASPEGSLTADMVLRDGGDAYVRPARATCVQVCNNTYPGSIPEQFERYCNCAAL